MKKIIYHLACLVYLLTMLSSCSKSELLNDPADEKLVELSISSNSTVALEYVVNGKVIGKVEEGNKIITFLVKTPGNKREIEIRKAGTTEILRTKVITSAPYQQRFSVNYDGTTVYDGSVLLNIKGYSGKDTMEFLMDGKVLKTGTGSIALENIPININTGQTREVQVRKQGETTVLARKTIVAGTAQQSLTFYYDGVTIVDQINLIPPADPANITISVKFESTVPNFRGPVDFVVFIMDPSMPESSPLRYTTTNYKITLPADGSFGPTIELPPVEGAGIGKGYVFRLFKSGTTDVIPYDTSGDVLLPLRFPYTGPPFTPGRSYVFIAKDSRVATSTGAPTSRGTTYRLLLNEIGQYFQ